MVSKASELLPEPDTPLITVSLPCGISQERFFRLCVRALRMMMASFKGKAPQTCTEAHCTLREREGATRHHHYKLWCGMGTIQPSRCPKAKDPGRPAPAYGSLTDEPQGKRTVDTRAKGHKPSEHESSAQIKKWVVARRSQKWIERQWLYRQERPLSLLKRESQILQCWGRRTSPRLCSGRDGMHPFIRELRIVLRRAIKLRRTIEHAGYAE
jgi:hypothetical protein